MPDPVVSTASTAWKGDLFNGSGKTTLDTSGLGTYDVAWKARTDPDAGTTNPEELLAAAHATCFSMAFSNDLASNGTAPTSVDTKAEVTFVAGTGITGIALTVRAQVEDISEEDFQRIAEATRTSCPVSQALAATPISLTATLA